ncbi:MAG: hypothetical protein H6811_05245 [Phycisphaeraceae bacterium]|nr:hypothetical protein [Phycisphaeraceae bacterium]
MPESPRHLSDDQDLDAQVESLVRQAEAARSSLNRPDSHSNAMEESSDPMPGVSLPPADAPETDGAAPPDPQAQAEAAVDDLDGHIAELSGQIDALLDEPKSPAPTATSESPRAARAAADAAASSNCSLDEQLAGLTDQLIEGELSDGQGQPVAPTSPTHAAPVPTSSRQPDPSGALEWSPIKDDANAAHVLPSSQTLVDDDSTLAQSPKAKPAPARATESLAPAPPSSKHAPKEPEPDPAHDATAGPPAPRAPARGRTSALSVVAAINKPLLTKPRIVRDAVGWLALWTLFLFACAVVYLVFFRHAPTPPESERPGAALAGAPD